MVQYHLFSSPCCHHLQEGEGRPCGVWTTQSPEGRGRDGGVGGGGGGRVKEGSREGKREAGRVKERRGKDG